MTSNYNSFFPFSFFSSKLAFVVRIFILIPLLLGQIE